MIRACVRKALASNSHGFTAFDKCLIHFATLAADAHNRWLGNWAKAVQVRCIGSWPAVHYLQSGSHELLRQALLLA